jgi:hypothetical protein
MNTFDTPVLRWGERSTLLPKRLFYAFSIQVRFDIRADQAGVVGRRLTVPLTVKPQRGDEWSTYHVLREDLVVFPDGVVREVPRGRLRRGTVFMDIGDNDVGNLDGRLLLETDTSAMLIMTLSGVLSLSGGTTRLFDDDATGGPPTQKGKSFIAVHFDSEHTKHRWLVENQLFGFGRVTGLPRPSEPKGSYAAPAIGTTGWELAVSFDLYSAG